MKVVVLPIVLAAAALVVWRWRAARRDALTVTDRWLFEQARRDERVGVDLPCWRSPKEIAEMARRDRMARIAEMRSRRQSA